MFDAKVFSRWGRVEFRGSAGVELFARSGNVDNPDRNWSPWKKIDLAKDAATGNPCRAIMPNGKRSCTAENGPASTG